MIIKSLEIKNIRNLKNCYLKPGENINIFYGENANGKTSLIESIYLVSNLKSFKTNNLSETINIENINSNINCLYEVNKNSNKLNFEINKTTKKYLKNDKKCKIDEYLWSLFSIVFVPDDILLINGSPSKRRDLIDRAIFYTNKNYINILKNYYKIISNKNINLKKNKINEIENWNILIAKYSSEIVSIRNNYINRINFILNNKLNIFGFSFNILKSISLPDDELENYFLNELKNNLKKEIKYKYSLIGAHRQNIDFNIDNRSLKIFGSQGQKKAFILLFRSSQIIDFETIHKFVPILLLDDMASELDHLNKKIYSEILSKFSGQIFITTTDKNLILSSDKVKYFHVENGLINSFSDQGA